MILFSFTHGEMTVRHSFISGFMSKRINNMKVSMVDNKLQTRNMRLSEYELSQGCQIELDSHADTSCTGRHVRILEHTDGKIYLVSLFNEKYQPIDNVKMVDDAIPVDCENGSGFIIELNNFLDFKKSKTDSLVVPMQARLNNVIVNYVPFWL